MRSVSLLRGAGQVLGAPGMPTFFAGFTIVWTALAAVNAFYSIQLVALGGSTTLVGITWAFGAIIEVPLMYAFPRLSTRFGIERLLVFGAVVIGLRGALAALAGDPCSWCSSPRSKGLGFACAFVGGVTYWPRACPPRSAGTAQGLFSAAAGLATIIGSAIGGTMAGALGISGLFAVCAAISLTGTVVVAYAVLGGRAGAGPTGRRGSVTVPDAAPPAAPGGV